jgi:hypothetical protein
MTKDQILEEIRRTAGLNGGIPLGWRRFIKETAILPYDIEKHWSLWSEAQKEAGFTPNTRNQRFDQKQLYQKNHRGRARTWKVSDGSGVEAKVS